MPIRMPSAASVPGLGIGARSGDQRAGQLLGCQRVILAGDIGAFDQSNRLKCLGMRPSQER